MKSQSKSAKRKPSKPTKTPQLKEPKRIGIKKKKLLIETAFARFQEIEPHPRCELYYETPFQLIVSVVLSAQTTDKMVNRCMEPLYKQGFTPETVLGMGVDGLLEKIRSIGLAPTKSKNVFKLAKIVLSRYEGRIPQTRPELEDLPGVGRKTANVVLGEIYQQPTIAVDTHVFRVTRRLGLHQQSSPLKCEQELIKLIDPKHLPQGHHWLILHGRYTCKAATPQCDQCVISDICPSLI